MHGDSGTASRHRRRGIRLTAAGRLLADRRNRAVAGELERGRQVGGLVGVCGSGHRGVVRGQERQPGVGDAVAREVRDLVCRQCRPESVPGGSPAGRGRVVRVGTSPWGQRDYVAGVSLQNPAAVDSSTGAWTRATLTLFPLSQEVSSARPLTSMRTLLAVLACQVRLRIG